VEKIHFDCLKEWKAFFVVEDISYLRLFEER